MLGDILLFVEDYAESPATSQRVADISYCQETSSEPRRPNGKTSACAMF